MRLTRTLVLLLFSFAFSCTVSKPVSTISYTGYSIEKSKPVDTVMLNMIKLYALSLGETMNKVIGFSNTTLANQQPESALGNFMADAIKLMASQKFQVKVDAAFMNNGGIRSYIPKGNITVGNIYELMPFDNLIVIQKISGTILQQFLDNTAVEGGWPVSRGLVMKIKNKKAIQVSIDGKPLDPNAQYVIANSDYVVDSGGGTMMLRNIPKQNKGYLMRDAFIDYITEFTKKGQPLDYSIENRVTNEGN
jgi:2',3'-cyclic-nucleotide 2'-phosphodiesterase (5'-nucleotidase family)